MSASGDVDADVLVVGAGPTGLATAAFLTRRGVAVRLVDGKPGPSQHSNALVVHARTLELLDLLPFAGAPPAAGVPTATDRSPLAGSVADEMVARGYPAPGLDLGSDPEAPVRMEVSGLDTRFPFVLVLPQSETEELLETWLRERDQGVERSTTFLGHTEQDGVVESRLRLPSGAEETVRSRYLVGADGAGSAVRTAMGLELVGRRYDDVFINAEVRVDQGLVTGGVSQYASPVGFAFVVPFRDGYFRIAALDRRRQQVDSDAELTLDDLQETVDAVIPSQPRLREPRWLTYWRTGIGQVPSYRVGRAFLAGDAAHVHSPAGGQGMNTGIQDGINLAWKLAAVLRGESPEAVLDSYEAERHPVGARAIKLSDTIVRAFLLTAQPWRQAVRDRLIRALVPRARVRDFLASNVSGLRVGYRDAERAAGTLRADLRAVLPHDALRAGDRMPDVTLLAAASADRNRPVRLYELLRDPRPVLVLVSRTQRAGSREIAETTARCDEVTRRSGGAVRPLAVFQQGVPVPPAATGSPREQGGQGERGEQGERGGLDGLDGLGVLVDATQSLTRATGARDGSALLVRPDGYLAFHRRGHDEAVAALFERWLRRPDSHLPA